MSPTLDVVVFGARGATGGVLVEEARRAGHRVTAAVRDPAAFAAPDGVDVVAADVRDPAGVRAALRGRTGVLSAIGPPGRRADGLYSAWARAVVDAADELPTARVVALSSSGARRGDPHHPLWYRVVARTVLRDLYDDMRAMEDVLARSPLDWTVVRPCRITDTSGPFRVEDGANPPGGREIGRADLARFAVGALTDPQWSRRRPTPAR